MPAQMTRRTSLALTVVNEATKPKAVPRNNVVVVAVDADAVMVVTAEVMAAAGVDADVVMVKVIVKFASWRERWQ